MGTQSPGSQQRTKQMFSEALLRLVGKRSFRKISVGDVCQEARLSRSAFYSHFEDKYELLSYSLSQTLRMMTEAGRSRPLEEQMLTVLTGIQENRRTFHNMFMADLSLELMDVLQTVFAEATRERLIEYQRAGNMVDGNIEFISAFLAGGFANVVLAWIRGNCAAPAAEIARCQCELLERMVLKK